MGTVLHLKRRCFACRREQVIKPSERHKTVNKLALGASFFDNIVLQCCIVFQTIDKRLEERYG